MEITKKLKTGKPYYWKRSEGWKWFDGQDYWWEYFIEIHGLNGAGGLWVTVHSRWRGSTEFQFHQPRTTSLKETGEIIETLERNLPVENNNEMAGQSAPVLVEITIKSLAFESKADRGFTIKAHYLEEPKGDALVEIFKDGKPYKRFLYPAYKVWNLAAHFSDIVESEIAGDCQGYDLAGWTGFHVIQPEILPG